MEQSETEPTPEQLDRLAGHVLTNPAFRAQFSIKPREKALELGIALTDAQVAHILTLNWEMLDVLSEDIENEAAFAAQGWSG